MEPCCFKQHWEGFFIHVSCCPHNNCSKFRSKNLHMQIQEETKYYDANRQIQIHTSYTQLVHPFVFHPIVTTHNCHLHTIIMPVVVHPVVTRCYTKLTQTDSAYVHIYIQYMYAMYTQVICWVLQIFIWAGQFSNYSVFFIRTNKRQKNIFDSIASIVNKHDNIKSIIHIFISNF